MIQDGFILVDKPEGWTSFKTDRFVGKLLGTRKVGHLGTLDPFATGLLPVFVGKGRKFQIWSEKNWEKEEQRIREKIKNNRPQLKMEDKA